MSHMILICRVSPLSLCLQELLTRSSLEHHKLDLMAEVSHLKMRLAAAEKDRRDADDRFRALQVGRGVSVLVCRYPSS